MAVARSGAVMPPKSTWFAPKPYSGLFVHPGAPGGPSAAARDAASRGTWTCRDGRRGGGMMAP